MSSPLPFCDQEDEVEVFFGNVTNKERLKAEKYNRRTAVFQPQFRQDKKLMRYTMDGLQLLSIDDIAQNIHDNKNKIHRQKWGSEGTDSCESQSPLGSSSVSGSPLGNVNGTISPLMPVALMNNWVDKTVVRDNGKAARLISDSSEYSMDSLDQSNSFRTESLDSPEKTAKECTVGNMELHVYANSQDSFVSKIQEPRDQNPERCKSILGPFEDLDKSGQTSLSQECVLSDTHNLTTPAEAITTFTDSTTSVDHVSHQPSSIQQGTCEPIINHPVNPQSVNTESLGVPACQSINTSVTMDTPQDTNVTMDTPQHSVTMDTPQHNRVTMDTPQHISTFVQSGADHSPLINGATVTNGTQVFCSPQPILGKHDLDSICHNGTTFHNVFSPAQSSSCNQLRSFNQDTVPDQGVCIINPTQEQEVPYIMTPVKHNLYGDCSDKHLVFDTPQDGDMSIMTIGVLQDDSMMDTSQNSHLYAVEDSEDELTYSKCHVVPEVDVELTPDVYRTTPGVDSVSRISAVRSRSGVTFFEKQFSPTLTVKSSPPEDNDNIDDIDAIVPLHRSHDAHPKSLFVNIKSPPPERETDLSGPGPVPQSPTAECLNEVQFNMNVGSTPQTSPKKSKVKRLSPLRCPKQNPLADHTTARTVGSVFERLYGLRKTPLNIDSSTTSSKPSSGKSTPVTGSKKGLQRSHSASKLTPHGHKHTGSHHSMSKVTQSASKCTTNASTHSSSTTPNQTNKSNTTTAKRGLVFSSSKCQNMINDNKLFSATKHEIATAHLSQCQQTSVNIRTTGTINPQALCQATSSNRIKGGATTPKSAFSKTICSREVTPKQKGTPGVRPPVYKKGTPRFPVGHKSSESRSSQGQSTDDAVKKLEFDDYLDGENLKLNKEILQS